MRVGLVLLALAAAACTPTAGAKTDAGDAARDAPRAGEASPTDAGDANVPDAATLGDPTLDALPASVSDDLTTRAKHLLEAIAHDDPALATDIVFPRDAYVEVKDAADPGKQWDTKVMALFQKQVHLLHKRTKGVERAQFVTFEIGEPVVQAVPKKHDLRRSLWRVRHSRLTYAIEGKAAHFDVLELTSWQGAWYITKLH
jgi:hypothetical protein